jgi:hypothetical protein
VVEDTRSIHVCITESYKQRYINGQISPNYNLLPEATCPPVPMTGNNSNEIINQIKCYK